MKVSEFMALLADLPADNEIQMFIAEEECYEDIVLQEVISDASIGPIVTMQFSFQEVE